MTAVNEEIIMLTLSAQHLSSPANCIRQIVKDLCGIQAQYFSNAVHALRLRYAEEVTRQSIVELVKTWTVRGTLHWICAEDWSLFVSALQNEWFDRWGKYLEKYFSVEERSQWQEQIFELICSGVAERDRLIAHFSKGATAGDLIQVALSSWGGILKDLAYQGRIVYAGVDQTHFQTHAIPSLLSEEAAKAKLIERYLIGYGPVTINDIAHWTQFRITEVKKRMREVPASLQTIVDRHGVEYFYLPGSGEVNTRHIPKYLFLAGFDPLLLGYKDKERFMKPTYHDLIFKKNGFVHSVLLHEGQVIGIWKKNEQRLDLQLFQMISGTDQNRLTAAVSELFKGEIEEVNIAGY